MTGTGGPYVMWRIAVVIACVLGGSSILDAVVFCGAALFNLGLEIPLGFTTLRFADSIWQAGTGESVIAAVLLKAGLTEGHRWSWGRG